MGEFESIEESRVKCFTPTVKAKALYKKALYKKALHKKLPAQMMHEQLLAGYSETIALRRGLEGDSG